MTSLTSPLTRESGSSAAAGAAGLVAAALLVAYAVLALAVHDRAALGLPGGMPADAAAAIAVGLVVLRRRRGHPAGWILVGCGLLVLLQTDGVLLSIVHYRNGTDPLPAGWPAVLAGLLWVPALLTIPPVVALFPDGRIVLPRGGTLLRVYLALAAAAVVYAYARAFRDLGEGRVAIARSTGDLAEFDHPHGGLAWWYTGWAALVLTALAAALAAAARKYRRSSGDTRQQLRWFLFGAILVASAVPPVVVSSSLSVRPGSLADQLPAAYLTVTLAALPITVGVGILRYRLYDLNLVVSRSIAYALLAALVAGVYLALVSALGVLVRAGSRSLGVSTVATVVAAALFQPLHARARRLADRLVYGARATPYEALTQFAEQLSGTYEVDGVLARAARVLAEATAAERVDVWLRSDDHALRRLVGWPPELPAADPPRPEALDRAALDGGRAVAPVRHQGELLGAISIDLRAGEAPSETDVRLLGQLAGHAGLVLHNAKLQADLRQRLEELVVSRRRLVRAQDEARRRLERDLHDGAQQQLIALNMSLGRVRAQVARVDREAEQALAELQAEIDDTLETVRTLSRGIYPPLLADRGLAAALAAHARKAPLPVAVESTLAERLPQEVEAAGYFCVLEALQNVYRHAGASEARVTLACSGETLRIVVSDDGCGFDVSHAAGGSGLANVHDRVDARGGTVGIDSSAGAGTTVALELPLAES